MRPDTLEPASKPVLKRLRAQLARRSFDYQWGALQEGRGLLSDPLFREQVDQILSKEELRVDRAWFAGRRVLDAGCGNGRWIEGFLRLGCEVTALDASDNAVEQVRSRYGGRVRCLKGDVLRADELLVGESFDLVFSWGVLHHTGDLAGGIERLARLVADDGLLYLYLYGRESENGRAAAWLSVQRLAANLLPPRVRAAAIRRRYGEERAHEVWDQISTPLNERVTFAEAEAIVRAAGLIRVTRTIPHSEVFLRADHGRSSADGHLLPAPKPPFWFQRLAEE
jgi:SAM-dependent methyltransferase